MARRWRLHCPTRRCRTGVAEKVKEEIKKFDNLLARRGIPGTPSRAEVCLAAAERIPIRVAERSIRKARSLVSPTDTPRQLMLYYLCRAMARKLARSILIFGLGLVTLPVVCATQKPYGSGQVCRHSAEK